MTALDRLVISRLVHRFGFGPRPGQFAAMLREGEAVVRHRVLTVASPDPGLASVVAPALSDLGPFPPAQTDARRLFDEALSAQNSALTMWWLDRMVLADHPLTERMTWFWHGHWATSIAKVAYALPMKSQNETLRAYALGNFGDLSRAMVLDGSLIYWLDGQINVASAPNENLGREFMELFTLGVGNYTEGDVKAVARSFTGYRVVRSNGVVSFSPNRHDTSTLSLLGTSGTFDAPSLSDYVVSLEANAVFVARRMWFRFISTTTPAPPSLARDFAGRAIAALVRAVASHPGIRNPTNVQAKSPVEWFVSACRALAITPSHLSSLTVTNYLSAMGQIPFAPPNVGGWPADEAWLTAASTQYRLAFAAYLVQSGDLSPVTRATHHKVPAVADWLGVARWSPRTTRALTEAAGDPARLTLLALCAPEYVVNA